MEQEDIAPQIAKKMAIKRIFLFIFNNFLKIYITGLRLTKYKIIVNIFSADIAKVLFYLPNRKFSYKTKRRIKLNKYYYIMKNFYVFRHGQTNMNVLNIWQGSKTDTELNATGKSQALELKKKIILLDIEVIYSSPLIRALQTAMLANPVPAETYVEPNLRECNFGDAEGQYFTEIETLYPEITYAMFHPTPDQWTKKFPGEGSESKKEVFERVIPTITKIAQTTNCTSIGISTHAAVMSSLLAGLGHPFVPVPNCCIAHFTYDEDELKFVEML